jgi:hypothetical protein
VVILATGVVSGLTIHIEAVGAGEGPGTFRSTTPLADAAEPRSEEILTVISRAGLLTVYCANTALDEVFKRVEASTGIRVVLEKPSARTCRSTAIEGQPLERALDRLLTEHGFSYVLILEPEGDIVAARIFDSGERVQRAPPHSARGVRGPLRRWPWFR